MYKRKGNITFLFKHIASTGFLLFCVLCSAFANVSHGHKVLVLHSYHKGYQWTDNIHEGIIETLKEQKNIDVFVEYMDIIRNPEPDFISVLEAVYLAKYTEKGFLFDVIIAIDDIAFDFILEKRFKLFGETPIVYLGVNEINHNVLNHHKGIFGVTAETAMKETIEIALSIFENTQRIVSVSGSRQTERVFLQKFKKAINQIGENIEVMHLSELEPDVLIDSLKNLRENDLVFYLLYLLTPSDESLTTKESISLISESTDLPVFTFWEFPIQLGLFGGKVVQEYSFGKTAAQIAVDIINDNHLESITILKTPGKFMFNGRELFKQQVSEKKLPNYSIIINRMPKKLVEGYDEYMRSSFFRYELFENHSSIMMLIEPETGVIIDVNKTAADFYGYPEIIGKSIHDINTLTSEDLQKEIVRASRLDQNYFNFKHRLNDGRIRNVEVFSYPLTIENTQILFSIIIDVTDKFKLQAKLARQDKLFLIIINSIAVVLIAFLYVLRKKNKRIEIKKEEIRKSEELFRVLAELSPVGIILSDKNHKALYISPKFTELFGYNIEDISSIEDWLEKMFPNVGYRNRVALEVMEEYERADAANSEFTPKVYTLTCKDNSVKQVELRAAISKEINVMIFLNVTDKVVMERTLLESNKNLEEIVYIASHDLQAPLISMKSYIAELAQNYRHIITDDGLYCLERLTVNAKRMHNLVLSWLDISRLNTEKLTLSQIKLSSVFNRVINDLSILIKQHDVNINIGLDEMPVISGDESKIELVLRNILNNSILYKAKNIKIYFNMGILSIEDDGIGIPKSQLDKIFNPGERIKMVDAEGVGLGLVFCKKVINLHGGEIWAESEGINKGATFCIRF
jgi:PAS domain S-box-containing protein